MLSTNSIFFIILSYWCLICDCQLDIGDTCHITEKNKSGSCKLLMNCKSALNDFHNKKYPQICGFQQNIPIVCCDEEKKTEEIGKIAEKKCWEYGESVYEHVLSPVQLLQREYVNKTTCTLIQMPLVVGGEDAKEQEFPHMALLGFGDKEQIIWQCGGTLISEQFVLTAAHCLNSRQDGNVKFIRLGELNKARTDDSQHQDFNVIEIIKHPNYLMPSRYDDIGLLKMDRKVKFNRYIRPACLQLTKYLPKNRYIATGWGINETFGHMKSDHLQKVILDGYSNEECNQKYKNLGKRALKSGIVDDTQICAGGKDELKDTCQGDSGGPLQIYHPQVHCMYSVVGITSFGKSCAGEPSVYTRVSRYIEWIENIVWQ